MSERTFSLHDHVEKRISNRVIVIKWHPARYTTDEFETILDYLFASSDEFAFVLFGEAFERGLVLFCGFDERFRTASVVRHVDEACSIVQDPIAPWFTGSALCDGFNEIRAVITGLLPNVRRWLLVGQSSGGYAAIVCSQFVETSIVLAFAPQTFHDEDIKNTKIHLPPSFRASKTMRSMEKMEDIRTLLQRSPLNHNSQIIIVASFSERLNPPSRWFWIDAMHWGRIVEFENVDVVIAKSERHPILLKRGKRFSKMISLIMTSIDDQKSDIVRIVAEFLHN